jgi:hypothetical protein
VDVDRRQLVWCRLNDEAVSATVVLANRPHPHKEADQKRPDRQHRVEQYDRLQRSLALRWSSRWQAMPEARR